MQKIFPADLHCHTILSGHAFNSPFEMLEGARKRGLKILAITEHGPAVPGAPHLHYFRVAYRMPEKFGDLEVLMGVEANILDVSGRLDIPENLLELQDVVLVGLHDKLREEMSYEGQSREDNTKAFINVIRNPHVNIITHPAYHNFPINVDRVVETACEHNTLLELNTSYLRVGRLNREIMVQIIKKVKDKGFPIVVNSDAHIVNELDNNFLTEKEMKEFGLTENDILNNYPQRLKAFFKIKGRKAPCFQKKNGINKNCI